MREAASAEVQQFEHLVERRRVARLRIADRKQPAQVAGDEIACQQGFPGSHPVSVATGCVDLAVVRDEPERVREWPVGERVRREAAVHHCQRRRDPLVAQIGEEPVELLGREHPLVREGARRQRREVDTRFVLGTPPQAERLPIQGNAGHPTRGAGHEQLRDRGHAVARRLPQHARIRRYVAPTDHAQLLLRRERLHRLSCLRRLLVVGRQECQAHGVRALRRQFELGDVA